VNKRSRRIRTFLLVISAALIAAAGVVAQETNALRRLDYSSVNKRFDIRGSQGAPKDVVVVAVDDRSFSEMNVQWPFTRSLHARPQLVRPVPEVV